MTMVWPSLVTMSWWSLWRSGGHRGVGWWSGWRYSAVTSVTAARAEDSSTMLRFPA